jgi:hypothetical protein
MRQAAVDRVDEGVAGVIKRLRDDFARDLFAFGRPQRTQRLERRAAAGAIAAGLK